jgi:hypothetical protein
MPVATIAEVTQIVEREMNVRVRNVRRQTRWRPTWFIEAERDGRPLNLVVRGERVDTKVFPLKHEVAFHQLLQDHGIPVPKIYKWIDELDAVVLEMVPGKPDFGGVSDSDRHTIVDEYLQVMARIHQLPIKPFVDAGIFRAPTPQESGSAPHWHMEKIFRAAKRHPHPFMEFMLGWLHRHPPQSKGRETPIIWDTGQFHHHNGHLVTILDLEFGCIGDPMLDLTVWRMRDTLIPFGDFKQLYRRYEEITGTEVDIDAIKLHHIGATLGNELMFGPAVQDPVPETDLMNNMQWDSETNLHATEALAEYLDVELPTVEMPEPKRTRQDKAFEHMVQTLRNARTDDYLLGHDLRLAFRMARHLQRTNQIGDAIVEADLDDIRTVTGRRPHNWWEADAFLERFVLDDANTGRHDEQLLWLFHRRNLRVHMQLGPEGSSMVKHYPTQRFD